MKFSVMIFLEYFSKTKLYAFSPILFIISGMGVYFAFQNRTVKKIIKDRVLQNKHIVFPLHCKVHLIQRPLD